MTDLDRDSYALRDEDRLPWLEAVDDAEDVERVSPLRLIGWLLAGLALLGLVIAGIWVWQNRTVAPSGAGDLIAAPEGPFKVKPEEPGGMAVEGKGDAAFATSAGAGPSGQLDLSAVPETPVTTAPAPQPAPQPAPAPAPATAAAPAAADAAAAAPAAGAGVIQLGAFDSQAIANEAWQAMTGRFAYLEGFEKRVIAAKVGGRTYYRLRAVTGSAAQARDVCARLKVAGEACLVID
jgi:hypothetical protein